jgi:hypothetical protein
MGISGERVGCIFWRYWVLASVHVGRVRLHCDSVDFASGV